MTIRCGLHLRGYRIGNGTEKMNKEQFWKSLSINPEPGCRNCKNYVFSWRLVCSEIYIYLQVIAMISFYKIFSKHRKDIDPYPSPSRLDFKKCNGARCVFNGGVFNGEYTGWEWDGKNE